MPAVLMMSRIGLANIVKNTYNYCGFMPMHRHLHMKQSLCNRKLIRKLSTFQRLPLNVSYRFNCSNTSSWIFSQHRSLNINVGDTAHEIKIVTRDDIKQFSILTGDYNWLHLDDEYAKRSRFGQIVGQGAYATAMMIGVMGAKLPGPGSILVSYEISHPAPFYAGDTLRSEVTIRSYKRRRIVMDLVCYAQNRNDKIVAKGSATGLVLKEIHGLNICRKQQQLKRIVASPSRYYSAFTATPVCAHVRMPFSQPWVGLTLVNQQRCLNINVGDKAHQTKVISKEDIRLFSELTGDFNEIHLDEEASKKSRFGQIIGQGAFATALMIGVLGTKLPGHGGILVSYDIKHPAAFHPGDTLRAEVTVQSRENRRLVMGLACYVQNRDDTIVAQGTASVFVLKETRQE